MPTEQDDFFTRWASLSNAEQEVALEMVKGKSLEEIAAKRVTDPESTIKTQARSVYAKMGIKNTDPQKAQKLSDLYKQFGNPNGPTASPPTPPAPPAGQQLPTPPPTSPQKPKRKWWLWGLIPLLVLILAVGVWLRFVYFRNLPFTDDFSAQHLSSRWVVMQGDPIIDDGRLASVGRSDITVAYGDNSLTNYTVEFDYQTGSFTLEIGTAAPYLLRYKGSESGQSWTVDDGKGEKLLWAGDAIGHEGKFSLTVINGLYYVTVNGVKGKVINYGSTVHGPLVIKMGWSTSIDNFSIHR